MYMLIIIALSFSGQPVGLESVGPYATLEKCSQVAEGLNVIMGKTVNAICVESR